MVSPVYFWITVIGFTLVGALIALGRPTSDDTRTTRRRRATIIYGWPSGRARRAANDSPTETRREKDT